MTGTSYVPGTWLGIVRSRTAVILGPETPAALAEGVWNLLAGKPEVYEVLQAITASAGGDLSRIPPFAILDFTGTLRVFLRGALELTVGTPDGPVALDGQDVTTWSERSFAAPGEAILGVPGAGSADDMQLRLGEGMVLLAQLRLGADAGQGVLESPAPAAADTSGTADAGAAGPDPAVLRAADPGASAVPTAVAVDSSGAAEVIAGPEAAEPGTRQATPGGSGASGTEPGEPELPGTAEGAERAAAEEAAPAAPETTIAPGLGDVSVETVYAVLDEDGEFADAGAPVHASESGPAADEDEALPAAQEGGSQPSVDAVPAIDQTSSYDHLWERTVMRNIEDAAVREDPSDEDPAPALEAAAPHAAIGPGDGADHHHATDRHNAADHQHVGDHTPAAGQDSTAQDSTAQEPAAQESGRGADAANPATQPPSEAPLRTAGLLIESVPWRTGGPATEPAQAAPQFAAAPDLPQAPPAPPSPPAFGAVAPPPFIPAASAEAGPPAAFDDDHDGQTVMKSSLPGHGGAQAAGGASQTPGPAAPAGAANGPLVLARVCQQGHANPPIRSACTVCGAPLPQDAVQVGRPRLGRMRLSTGELLDLDQSLVIGRQPSVSRVQGGVMPRLVQVPSPAGDISRSHVEVRLEGWHVMLCDLKATNGTVLVREGQPPRRLAQNEMAILLDGDIAELGDNISLRFEEIP